MARTEKTRHAGEEGSDLVNSVIEEATEKVTGLIDDAKGAGEKWMGKIKDRGSDLIDEAQERGQGAWKDMQSWVRKNPGPAVGWAFVAGAVLYAFLSRSED